MDEQSSVKKDKLWIQKIWPESHLVYPLMSIYHIQLPREKNKTKLLIEGKEADLGFN
jgi:hypothetical protein